ncbi:hypothetical protein SCO12_05915 [Legionella pneumophila serogroup 10]
MRHYFNLKTPKATHSPLTQVTKLTVALASYLSVTSYAAFSIPKGQAVLELGGASISKAPTQLIAIGEGSLGNIHRVYHSQDLRFLAGLGYFFDVLTYKPLSFGLGPQIYYLKQHNTQGVIDIERAFPNLSYQYQTQNTPLYAAVKAKWAGQDEVSSLVLNAGIGPNFIKTKNYYEHSLDDGITIPNQAFAGQSRTRFSAMAGLGLQFKTPHKTLAFEVGYKYFYLGEGTLNPRPGFLNQLTTGHQSTHALTLSLLA